MRHYIPPYIGVRLSKAFSGTRTEDGHFVIWNDLAHKWLLEHYPIYTEGNEEIDINIGIIFWRWDIQRWTIR